MPDDPIRPQGADPQGRLRLASTLAWTWGILTALIGLSIGLPRVLESREPLVLIYFGLPAGVLCYAGWALRKGRISGGWAALLGSGWVLIESGMRFFGGAVGALIGVLVNAAILLLVISNWRTLNAHSRDAA
jgi:hypothetical protein